MALDPGANFSKSTLSTGYASGATTLVLTTGGGAKFPAPSFNAVYYDSGVYADPSDDPNVEIIRVTGVSTDTLTVTRAQEGTSAANHNTAGHTYTLVAGPTSKLLTDILGIDITGKSAKTDALNSASTIVNVAAATAPVSGQALIATGSTTATWQSVSNLSLGSAADFQWNGIAGTSYMTVPDNAALDATTGVSVSGWVKIRAQTTIWGLFAKGSCWNANTAASIGDYALVGAGAGDVYFGINGTSSGVWGALATYAQTLSVYEWHHVVGTYSTAQNSAKLYVDGALVATSAAYSTAISTSGSIGVAGSYYNKAANADCLNGWIDDIRIYKNAALSAADVTLLYNAGVGQFALNQCSANETVCWRMDSASGTTNTDVVAGLVLTSAGAVPVVWGHGIIMAAAAPTVGTFTNGAVPYIAAGILAQDPTNFFWDGTNHRLGIGTAAPGQLLSINSAVSPTVAQFAITAAGAGMLSGLTYGTNNANLMFDADWTASAWYARGTTAYGLQKQSGVLSIVGDHGLTIGNTYSPTVQLVVAATNGYMYTQTLKVGIGTATPGEPLDVYGTGGTIVNITASTGTNAVLCALNNTSNTTYFGNEGSSAGGSVTGSLAYASLFGASTSAKPTQIIAGGAVVTTFLSSGNVGIGTAAPGSPLHIATPTSTGITTLLKLGVDAVGIGGEGTSIDFYDVYGVISRIVGRRTGASAAGQLGFYTGTGGSSTEKMTTLEIGRAHD